METINIADAPMIAVVGTRKHPKNAHAVVDVLECGHWMNRIRSERGCTERRCWKCLRGWSLDSDEAPIVKKRKAQHYIRAGVVAIEDVLPHVDSYNRKSSKREYLGHMVKMGSGRLKTFVRSTVCAKCGIEGEYFAVERHRETPVFHLNLYAVDDDGVCWRTQRDGA